MIDPAQFVDDLVGAGVTLYTGVPDSLLKAFGTHVMATVPRDQHVIAANEGGAVAIALGHHLRTGELALVYLQNSGFGNLVNPLLSLADPGVYGVPMLVLVGWRGQPGVKDEPQHVTQGRVMTDLLDAMGLPWAVLPAEEHAASAAVAVAAQIATERSTPYLLLVEKDTFAAAEVGRAASAVAVDLASREEALVATVEALGDDVIIVSTTGMLSRELFEYRERSGSDGRRDFLTVGGMGHASAIALGIALREPDREVWCLDGDGALLMHLGGLAVIADHAPARYHHVMFNNGVHDSVGGQPTSITRVDVAAAALALGYRAAATTDDLSALPGLLADHRERGGPSLIDLRVRPGNRDGIGRPTRTPVQSKQVFMSALR
ncbi:MAG: phosphonopyruvate decarboxylase [Nitriliruptor sp.]|nr:MAG: phosphonopyruvate decarboxylase [Nitriliruptor sp.]